MEDKDQPTIYFFAFIDEVHGGSERVRFKDKNPKDLFDNLYISARIFKLSDAKNTPGDWRLKGECVGFENKSFGEYLEKYGVIPEFNVQKKSLKKII